MTVSVDYDQHDWDGFGTPPWEREATVTQPDHRYDTSGVCILCNRCEDEDCCEQVPCDQKAWKYTMSELERMKARAYFGDLP